MRRGMGHGFGFKGFAWMDQRIGSADALAVELVHQRVQLFGDSRNPL
jgi:hypothetical protein